MEVTNPFGDRARQPEILRVRSHFVAHSVVAIIGRDDRDSFARDRHIRYRPPLHIKANLVGRFGVYQHSDSNRTMLAGDGESAQMVL